MSKKEDYEKRTQELLMPIIERNSFELVDVEYVKEAGTYYLRAYIDKEGGFTIDDCELVSRELSDLLDEKDFIDDSYILEVSSPGLGRVLKKENDYKRNIGKEIEIKLFKPINGQKEYEGILVSYTDDDVCVKLSDETEITILKKDMSLIRQAVHF